MRFRQWLLSVVLILALWPAVAHGQSREIIDAYNRVIELYAEGRYGDAVPFAEKVLRLGEREFGPEHPNTAAYLAWLALLYDNQGKYAPAEPLYQRALAISKKALGPDHPDVATSLNNLALLYHIQAKYAAAEPLSRRALAIDEKALGPDHPNTATSLHNLALR